MTKCKDCHRVSARLWLRKKRRYGVGFKKAERMRHRAYYQAHRAERLAYDRARRARVA